jgi:plasmid replication initiation protein
MSNDVSTRATSRQMSLELFEEMLATDTPIHKSTKEIGYQRNNVFVDVTDVGVTARRLLDAAHFIVAQEQTTPKYYDVELSYFRWLMRYDSYNYKHLRAVVSEAQKALIQVSTAPQGSTSPENEKWISVQLLGIVGIDKGRITFEVPQPLIRHIKDPEKSHWLSLRITSAFTLTYARAIYDHVIAYLTDGVTDWFEIELVRNWPGKAGSSATVFKYFKRDSLEPAVRQINEVSDIELSYETRTESPKSKKIDRIRFRLSRKEGADTVRASLIGLKETYTTLKSEFGFTEKQFNLISQNRAIWSDERIVDAIEYTRTKIDDAKVIKSPAGYLMKAITEGYKLSEAERRMKTVLAKKAMEAATEVNARATTRSAVEANSAAREEEARLQLADEVRAGRETFDQLEPRTRKDFMRAYVASPSGKLAIKRLKFNIATIDETDVLSHADLSFAFYHFVYLRNKPRAARSRV